MIFMNKRKEGRNDGFNIPSTILSLETKHNFRQFLLKMGNEITHAFYNEQFPWSDLGKNHNLADQRLVWTAVCLNFISLQHTTCFLWGHLTHSMELYNCKLDSNLYNKILLLNYKNLKETSNRMRTFAGYL